MTLNMPGTDDPIAAQVAVDVRSTTGRWWLAALLTSGMTLCYAQRGTLSIAAPFMIRELGINTETMGLMLSPFRGASCPAAADRDRHRSGSRTRWRTEDQQLFPQRRPAR
jgi:hypothetical protein